MADRVKNASRVRGTFKLSGKVTAQPPTSAAGSWSAAEVRRHLSRQHGLEFVGRHGSAIVVGFHEANGSGSLCYSR